MKQQQASASQPRAVTVHEEQAWPPEQTWSPQSYAPQPCEEQPREFQGDEEQGNMPQGYEASAQEPSDQNSSKKSKRPGDLGTRVRTAVVYFVLSIVLVVVNTWTTLIYIVITVGLSAHEFFGMMRTDAKLPNEVLGLIGAMLFPVSVFFLGYMGILYVALAFLLALLIWYVFSMRSRITDIAVTFFGALYTGLLLCGLVVIRDALPDLWGGLFVFGIFLSVWANDAGAYLIGSRFGKHKLAPKVSPNKSWEGFLAGLVVSMIIWVAMSFIPGVSITIIQALVFGLIVGLMGVLGDLAESRMKRNCGVKDSGTILPGHGGMLDRTDSMFTVSIAAAVLLIAGGCI